LLAFAARGLPAGHDNWRRAMYNELTHVRGSASRWRFSLGCVAAITRIQTRSAVCTPPPGTRIVRAVVLGGIATAAALTAFGLERYPELRSASGTWPAIAACVALLVAYAVMALVLSGSVRPGAMLARRHGLIGGLAVGGAWFVILSPTHVLKAWVALPLVVVLLGPACTAALVGRAAREPRAATHAALWSGIIGGLVAFAIWMTATYVRAGRPYDAGLIRDFHRSGAPSLPAYAVGENFGSGLVLLMLVPIVALALGSLAGRAAAAASRT
jgi:hypothetical protein